MYFSVFIMKWSEIRSAVPNSLWPWNSPGQNTGVGSLPLLQGIFWTQGLNPGPLNCRQIHYQLSHKGSPRILEWVSLSLLQRIFPAQESNRGLLLCRQILYQLSYQDGKGNNWEYTVHCFIYSFIMNVWRRKGKSMTSLPLMYHSLVLAKGLVP